MNNNYNPYFLYPKEPTSASEMARMDKLRNPIIETDKNIEKCLVENKYQTQVLNETQKIINANAEIVKQLSLQVKSMEESSNKQFKITVYISVATLVCTMATLIATIFK